MTFKVDIKNELPKVMKAMDAFGKSQMPFAVSKTLNDAAFSTRTHIIKSTMPRTFAMRNKQFGNAMFRVQKSTKKKLFARVFDRLGREYMSRHTTGGTKTARGGDVAVPTKEIRRGARGVTKSRRPRQLLVGGKRAFRQTIAKSGQDAILQRRGKKRYPLKVLYILEPSTKIKKTFKFYEEATKVATKTFQRRMIKNFKMAKKTAIRKMR